MKVAIGFRAHLGWAAAVAVGGMRANPALLDRRRIDLSSESIRESHEPYHKAAEVRDDETRARAIVERGTRAVHAEARKAVRALIRDLESAGHTIVAAGVLLDLGRQATFESTLRSHALVHTAEGQLMRAALVAACEACDVRVVGVREREISQRAALHLRLEPTEVASQVNEIGRDQGPPWRQDQKQAALVAWLALAGLRA